MARSSGERGWRKARAVAVSLAARLSGPTAVASKSAAPSTDERARPHLLARAARTTGSDSPVRFASSSASPSRRRRRSPSATTWSPAVTRTRSPTTTCVDRHAALAAVAHDHRLRRDERRQPVERALRADLLERPDHDVRDQDPHEQRVLPRGERDRQDPEDEQDPVGDVDRVRDGRCSRTSGSTAGAGAARARPAGARPRPRSGRWLRRPRRRWADATARTHPEPSALGNLAPMATTADTAELTEVEQRNLKAVADVLEFWNTGDIDGIVEFYDDEIVWTNVALEEVYRGKERGPRVPHPPVHGDPGSPVHRPPQVRPRRQRRRALDGAGHAPRDVHGHSRHRPARRDQRAEHGDDARGEVPDATSSTGTPAPSCARWG